MKIGGLGIISNILTLHTKVTHLDSFMVSTALWCSTSLLIFSSSKAFLLISAAWSFWARVVMSLHGEL